MFIFQLKTGSKLILGVSQRKVWYFCWWSGDYFLLTHYRKSVGNSWINGGWIWDEDKQEKIYILPHQSTKWCGRYNQGLSNSSGVQITWNHNW